jgi:hypothetical protein
MQQGIQYKLTGETARGSVTRYHGKPDPINLSRGAKNCDIAGLKKVQRGNFIESFGDYRSKFTIGFEVEKNSLHRGAVREYELFCGFETDGSCGYEAVTHILPLVPASTWRTKVFDMIHKAERIIDDRFSPSNEKRGSHYKCGGHITIGHPEAKRIAAALRQFAQVIPDYRMPNSIRLAISPLPTSFIEVYDGFERIRESVMRKDYEKIQDSGNRVT